MSYTIDYDFTEYNEDNTNLSQELLNDDDYLETTERYLWWLADEYKLTPDECEEASEYCDEFRETNTWYELQDEYVPIMNYAYILQYKPRYEQVYLVAELVPTCSIIYIEDLGTYALGLTGGGMDLSDCLELAYMIIDGVSPIQTGQVMSLSDKATKLLYFCREYIAEHGSVHPHLITDFLKEN